MLRVRIVLWSGAVLLGLVPPTDSLLAQVASAPEAVGDLLVPGGLRSAVAVTDDRATTANAHSLLDLIRSVYGSEPSPGSPAQFGSRVQRLVAHLDRSSEPDTLSPPVDDPEPLSATHRGGDDRLPLPLPEHVWTDTVFDGRATTGTLLARILESRSASLFYYGLLSLDDETRAWLANEPALIREAVTRCPASFVVAAPGLRVVAGRIRPPGGDRAEPAWEALVGRPMSQPGAFTRALLAEGDGRLAYFYAAMAALSDRQLRFGLNLDAEAGERVAAARRLYRAFEQVGQDWTAEESPFRRPTHDPALLLADLSADHQGAPVLPGGATFWQALLEDAPPGTTSLPEEAARRLAGGPPVNFSWLCERISRGGPHRYRRGHLMVLSASRLVKQVTPETAADAIDALRATDAYPALIMTLERAGVHDVAILARAARRAAELSRIGDGTRAARSLAQYQGAIFMLARAAIRGALPAGAVADDVASMVAVVPGRDGDYEGRLVRWLGAFLESRRPHEPLQPSSDIGGSVAALGAPWSDDESTFDDDLLRLLAGGPDAGVSLVDWEGSRYRVSFAAAERSRIVALLGDDPRPYVGAARMLVELSDRVSADRQTPGALREHANGLADLLQTVEWERDVKEPLEGAVQRLRAGEGSNLAVTLRLLADELLARGLLQYAYATALGQPSQATVSAGDAAGRHYFGVIAGQRHAWQVPIESRDYRRGGRLSGSVLGVDVALADRSQVSVSSKPPRRAPTVNGRAREVFAQTIALAEPTSLTDTDMRAIAAAIGRGRERATRLRTREEALAVADEIRLDPDRRTLLAWTAPRRPEWLSTFLAPVELFWLGLDGAPLSASLHAWGAPAGPRVGCLCLYLDAPRPLGVLANRWDAALLVSGFADLNLRLAELLSQLGMPASLLAPVLAAATLDLVNTAHQRDRDDRRGLEAFVHALRVEHVEQYLALLTTGGPLVPVDDETAVERAAQSPGGRR